MNFCLFVFSPLHFPAQLGALACSLSRGPGHIYDFVFTSCLHQVPRFGMSKHSVPYSGGPPFVFIPGHANGLVDTSDPTYTLVLLGGFFGSNPLWIPRIQPFVDTSDPTCGVCQPCSFFCMSRIGSPIHACAILSRIGTHTL